MLSTWNVLRWEHTQKTFATVFTLFYRFTTKQKFDRPPNAFVHIPTENKSATLPRQSQTKPKPQPQQRSTPPEISKTERRRTQSDELLVNGLQVATVLKTMKLANKALRQEDEMPGVVEGYMENVTCTRLQLNHDINISSIFAEPRCPAIGATQRAHDHDNKQNQAN